MRDRVDGVTEVINIEEVVERRVTPAARRPDELFAAAEAGTGRPRPGCCRSSSAAVRAPARSGGCPPRCAGDAYTIGLTGAPGAGKSTLTSALIAHLRAAGRRGRRAGRRPVVAVHRRGHPRRPGAHAGPRHRPRRVHPLDGHPRPPRRAVAGDAGGDPPARRARAPLDHRRDRRRRPGRGRGRRQGRHDGRRRQPRVGRQRAGQQGRPDGGRRRLRHQQGRPARRRARPGATCEQMLELSGEGAALANAGWSVPIVPTVGARGEGVAALWDAVDRPPRPRHGDRACWSAAAASASARSCARSSPAASSSGPARSAPASAGTR